MEKEKRHMILVNILSKEDLRLRKQEDKRGGLPNPYRIGLFLKALDRAENNSDGIEAGLSDAFTHSRLRDKLRKSIGLETCNCKRAGSCGLCSG